MTLNGHGLLELLLVASKPKRRIYTHMKTGMLHTMGYPYYLFQVDKLLYASL